MDEKVTCCKCRKNTTCIIWKTLYRNLPMDTDAVDYGKKFGNLYQTIADFCTAFEGNELDI